MSRVLIVHDGKRERELLLVERLVIGRDPACDFSVDDGLLSRRHVEFVAASAAVTVRDLGSRNGIFVNGTRCSEQTLNPGDVVQIGPLRVRYQLDRTADADAPARMDADGTMMVAAPPVPLELASPAPMRASFDTFRGPAPQLLDPEDNLESETRVGGGTAFAAAMRSLPADGEGATSFTPTPRHGAMSTAAFVLPPRPVVTTPPPVDVATGDSLATFILIQLGSLAVVVFVVTVAPLFLTRGTVLSAITDGSLLALLIWPFLPLVISLAATLIFAHVVNRRLIDVFTSGEQSGERR